jgi:hypothetical protein
MKTGMHIGPKIGKKNSKFVTKFVVRVFESGAKNNMDQETIRRALDVYLRLGEGGNGNTISDCTIYDSERETS